MLLETVTQDSVRSIRPFLGGAYLICISTDYSNLRNRALTFEAILLLDRQGQTATTRRAMLGTTGKDSRERLAGMELKRLSVVLDEPLWII